MNCTCPHYRDSEDAYVSLNGKRCWTKRSIAASQGTQQCGEQGIFDPWNEYAFPVTGCSVTLSGSGNKPLTVRVYTNLDAEDAKDESFGITNVVIRNVPPSNLWLPNRTSCRYRLPNTILCVTFTTTAFCDVMHAVVTFFHKCILFLA